jgi:hypothetical protein
LREIFVTRATEQLDRSVTFGCSRESNERRGFG